MDMWGACIPASARITRNRIPAQARGVVASVQRAHRQERYPVDFLFVERFEEDFVARPNGMPQCGQHSLVQFVLKTKMEMPPVFCRVRYFSTFWYGNGNIATV
jgi:hypothetical protein